MADSPRVLLIGYGNPGRRDDGLGPAVADAVAALAIDGVTVEAPYQLQVEDAATVADHDVVVFADADAGDGAGAFTCREVVPENGVGWTSHALTPGAVLAMARGVYGACPPAFLLAVRGFEFDPFDETLSAPAREHLAAAVAWLTPRLRDGARGLRAGLDAGTIGV